MMKMKNLLVGMAVTAAAGTALQGASFSTYKAVVDSANGLRNTLSVSVVGQTGRDTVNYSRYIGAFEMTDTSNPGESWYSFCTDLSVSLRKKYEYAEVPVTSSAPSPSVGRPQWDEGGIQSAAAIYKAHVNGMNGVTGADRQNYGAALQLAIWEALYDTGTSDLGGGNFTASGLSTGVETYFSTFMGAAGGSYAGVNWLQPKELGKSQGGFRRVAVPEPATLLTSVLALGLGWLGRRRLV